ncbi:MAG: response regulator [Acidobacteria bacterium]|nr:response regulator [Acidobacteriota bacterium]
MSKSASTPEELSILVVDDEQEIRNAMAQYFSGRGYKCQTAENGDRALDLVQEYPWQAVLSDLAMEGANGLEVSRKILQSNPKTAVVLMTGKGDVRAAIEAFRLGVSDFLLKPFDLPTAQRSVERAVLKKKAEQGQEEEIQRLQDSLQRERAMATAIAETLHWIHNLRDLETSGHSKRVSRYAVSLGQEIGLSQGEQEILRVGGLLHDIGKVVIPDRILLKTGPPTEEEWCIIRKHSEVGHRILAGVPGFESAAQIVLEHHERYDGRGYPRGVVGEGICLGARIFAVADTYDAITPIALTERRSRRGQHGRKSAATPEPSLTPE